MSRPETTATRIRWRRAKPIRASITDRPFLLPGELRFEHVGAGDHDLFAFRQSLQHMHKFVVLFCDLDDSSPKLLFVQTDEHNRLPPLLLDGGFRNGDSIWFRLRHDAYRGIHLRFQSAVGIGHLDPHPHGPSGWIEHLSYMGDLPAEEFSRIGGDLYLHRA